MRIIAGPGSGKTYTLVQRIVHLIKERDVAPESLFVVTFTNKAARELTNRVSKELAKLDIPFNPNDMHLGTIHSICVRILKEYQDSTRLMNDFRQLDQFDQQYFLYQNIWDFRELPDSQKVMGGDQTGPWRQSENLMNWLNKVREEALDPIHLENATYPEVRALAACFRMYEKLLSDNNFLDFSGMQYEVLKLLERNPAVLNRLREKITYLMVDEYQDTNTIQERILFLLAGENGNLCVVGDDDQGLYRFRGATVRNILEFPEKFQNHGCKEVALTENFRSPPDIVQFCNNWMKRLDWSGSGKTFRSPKQIRPSRDDIFLRNPTAVRLSAFDEKGENDNWNREVLEFLKAFKDADGFSDWNQVAFLFRSVKNPRVLELARFLEDNGVHVYSPRSNIFFEREEVQLMIGAMIFLFPQFSRIRKWSEDAHLPVWEYYDRHCSRPFSDELRKPENLPLSEWAGRFAEEHADLNRKTDYAYSWLFYQLLQFPLFSRYLNEEAMQGIEKGRAARNLAKFSNLITKFEYLHNITILNPDYLERDLRRLFNNFFRFLKEGGVGEYEDEVEYAPKGYVSFMTIHQSKGLEFPVVVCDSLEAVPRKQYKDLDEILENGGYLSKPGFEPLNRLKYFDFWRLYYTAFSRAKNLLILAAQERAGKGMARSPSKYFVDVLRPLPDWREVDFRQLDFDEMEGSEVMEEYSFTSHIMVFENCAEQYRFFKELEFTPIRLGAMRFGTLVHQTIEDIHKAVLRGEEHIVTPEAISTWLSSNYAMISKTERVYLAPGIIEAARQQVLHYYQLEKDRWDRIRETEIDISLAREGYILNGRVDLIRGEGDTVEVVDFKSEDKPDMEMDDERLRLHQRQLEVYAHLIEEKTGQKVSKLHIYYTSELNGDPYVTFAKKDREIGNTLDRFDKIVNRIENGDYRMAARPHNLCRNCEMRAYCDAKNWNFMETE